MLKIKKLILNSFTVIVCVIVLSANNLSVSAADTAGVAISEVKFLAEVLKNSHNYLLFQGYDSNELNYRSKSTFNIFLPDDYSNSGILLLDAQGNPTDISEIREGHIVEITHDGFTVETSPVTISNAISIQLVNARYSKGSFNVTIQESGESHIVVQGFTESPANYKRKFYIDLGNEKNDFSLVDTYGNALTAKDIINGASAKLTYDGRIIDTFPAQLEGSIKIEVNGGISHNKTVGVTPLKTPSFTSFYVRILEFRENSLLVQGDKDNSIQYRGTYIIPLTKNSGQIPVLDIEGNPITIDGLKNHNCVYLLVDGYVLDTFPNVIAGNITIHL